MKNKPRNQYGTPSREKVLRAAALRHLGKSQAQVGLDLGVPRAVAGEWIREWPARLRISRKKIEAEAQRIAAEPVAMPEDTDQSKRESLRVMLKHAYTLDEIAKKISVPRNRAVLMVQELRDRGVMVQQFGEHYQIAAPAPSTIITTKHIHVSEPNGYYKFGYTTDNHLCSKYAREDVLNDLYDWFAAEGVKVAYNTGNWIDGEARFNKHDITVHGMQNQVNYFAKHFPRRPGLVTKFISGDDHEGWYGQREGVDIGWLAQKTAEEMGRTDLIHLGFIEAFVRLQHAEVKKASTTMLLVHPGGGSAYATSYAPQKYVEALQGGEKPAVILFGHWHKVFDLLIRNIICLGGGCTKDLDTFGRKMKLQYHLAGMIVELWQDPATGAITRYRVEKKQYFDRGYYNDQWSYTGQPERNAA